MFWRHDILFHVLTYFPYLLTSSILFDIITYFLTSRGIFLMSWHTFWPQEVLFDVTPYLLAHDIFLPLWCNFWRHDAYLTLWHNCHTLGLTSWPRDIFFWRPDILASTLWRHDVLSMPLTSGQIIHTFRRHDVLFDVATYFLGHNVHYTPWYHDIFFYITYFPYFFTSRHTFLCQDILFYLKRYLLMLWHTFLRPDIPFYVRTYFFT